MKRLLILLLALLALTSFASAEELLTMAEPLEGVHCWPEDCDESSAAYVYRYSYPQVAGNSEAAELINTLFAEEVSFALDFRIPMEVSDLDPDAGVQVYTNLSYEITCLNERYLSVLITRESSQGPSIATTITGHTFALGGDASSGAETNLPYLLGLLNGADATDEWLQERQTAKADNCVRGLIWAIIEEQMMNGSVAFDPDLTRESFDERFFPETAFYLDADGNPVFYLQEGSVALPFEGILRYPFTLEELLDEI